MKTWQLYSFVACFVISILTLGGYGYNISAFVSGLSSRVFTLEKQRDEDRQVVKENLNYIRDRVDQINSLLLQGKNQTAAPSCGQCKDH